VHPDHPGHGTAVAGAVLSIAPDARIISVKVLNEYNRNPGVTRTRLYYEMFLDVFKDADTVDLIDKNLRNFIPFKPLEGSASTGQGGTQ